jgi:uncharacterized protein (DUF2147 family)
MKKLILAAIVIICSCTHVFAQNTTNANDVLGIWLSEKKDGKVEIYKQGDKYFGKLIWGKTMFENDGVTSKKDVSNTDTKLKNRNLKDLIILTDFVFDDGVWNGGKIYDPEVGKLYNCAMRLKNNMLKIRGYIGISLFGRTSEWTRIQ